MLGLFQPSKCHVDEIFQMVVCKNVSPRTRAAPLESPVNLLEIKRANCILHLLNQTPQEGQRTVFC